MNGTFFLDARAWPHRCDEKGGGWGDFFASDDVVVPWTPQAEKAGGAQCVRVKAKEVDEMLHKLNTGTDELDGMAVNMVGFVPLEVRQLCRP